MTGEYKTTLPMEMPAEGKRGGTGQAFAVPDSMRRILKVIKQKFEVISNWHANF